MLKKIIAAAALATIAASSQAATPGSVYAGLDVGTTESNDYPSRTTSYGGFVGYNVNENIAIEGAYRRLGSLKYSDVDNKMDQAALSVVGSLPVGNGFAVFGRLGYNRLDHSVDVSLGGPDSKEHVSKVLSGVGVSYNFDSKISARLEAQRLARNVTNVSAGVAYSF